MTVPSVTDSPRAGMETIVDPAAAAATGLTSTTGAATTGATTTGATGAATTGATGAATTGAADPALSLITANSAPTATVESMGTTIFCRTPATGDGISVSTLSVDTSKSGSSTAT